jgi:hypothetical protein
MNLQVMSKAEDVNASPGYIKSRKFLDLPSGKVQGGPNNVK